MQYIQIDLHQNQKEIYNIETELQHIQQVLHYIQKELCTSHSIGDTTNWTHSSIPTSHSHRVITYANRTKYNTLKRVKTHSNRLTSTSNTVTCTSHSNRATLHWTRFTTH